MSKDRMAVHYSGGTPEWHTPRSILERAEKLLGGIDLDPCAEAARGVPAKTHYTLEDDGLSQAWSGTVFMNPPYGRSIGAWTEKLARVFSDLGDVYELARR